MIFASYDISNLSKSGICSRCVQLSPGVLGGTILVATLDVGFCPTLRWHGHGQECIPCYRIDFRAHMSLFNPMHYVARDSFVNPKKVVHYILCARGLSASSFKTRLSCDNKHA